MKKSGLSFDKTALFIALMAFERLGGLISIKLSLFLTIFGLAYILKTPRIHKIGLLPIIVGLLATISGIEQGWQIQTGVRGLQLILISLTFVVLVDRIPTEKISKSFIYLVPILLLVFIFELIIKPDLLKAYTTLNLNYFLNSGGTTIDDGLQLIAQGNVYAASIAGTVSIVCFIKNAKFYGFIALFLAISTGSRALFVALLLVYALFLLRKYFGRKALRFCVLLFTFTVLFQPIFYKNIQVWLPEDLNNTLYYMSPRYVAFIAYANMGLDNLFGVGYFRGSEFSDYFFARWPIPAHNMIMTVFGEMGIIAYFVWSLFLIKVGKIVSLSIKASVLFVFVITMYTFIGGFNEWSFWVPLALAYKWGAEANYIQIANKKMQQL